MTRRSFAKGFGRAKKIASVSVIVALLFSQTSFAFAQTLDSPSTSSGQATAPEPEPTTVIEPTPAATPTAEPTTEPVTETVAPADTGPAFISVATASAQESEATVVWTTDELAYGFVEYGETASYGLSTPKSASAELDHTVAVSNLTPGTVYHYRIVAEDQSGNIRYSKDRTLETALEVVAIDNVPPDITNVSVANITTSGATISWTTDELAQGKIEYGKTAEYGTSSPLASDYADAHSASLSNLDPNTEYHYRVVVQDESGNEAVSPDEVFTTDHIPATPPAEEPVVTESDSSTGSSTSPQARSDPSATATTTPQTTATSTPATTPTPEITATSTPAATTTPATATSTPATSTSAPATGSGSGTGATPTAFAISHVETAAVSTSTATIIWETNEPATSQVLYGVGETYASSSALSAVRTASHEIKLTGLKPGTNYFYKVISKNASGKTIEKSGFDELTTSGFEFNTLYKQKKIAVAPTISNIRVQNVGTSTAVVVFTTDLPATGRIHYGTTTGYEETDGGHGALLTAHSHPLSGLTPNTLYNFETLVWDASGNQTIYKNMKFTTLPKAATEESQPVAPAPAPTPAPSRSSGGGGGGGGYYYVPQKIVGKPVVTKVDPRDEEVLFVWQKAKPESGLKTIIVRNDSGYASSPTQGEEVYRGNSGRFADTDLTNKQTYYYSVFRVSETGTYSAPINFTVVPKQDKTQTNIIATPPVVQKTPIYTFSKTLSRGDENKKVEHLQVLLASESSLYPKGLITGYFGPLTEHAVTELQKRYELPVTGVADTATLRKLEQLSSIEITKDKADVHDKALTRDLTVGRIGADVSIVQQFLVNAEVYPEALVTGYFGALTKSAVQRFQQEQNINPAYGYFGPITKKRMLNLIRLRSVSF